MDVTCNVIEDLLPLYADGICSEDTRTIIEHHTAMCPECREKLEAMTLKLEKNEKKVKIENPFKKVKNHYLRTAIVTLLVCAFIIVPVCGIGYLLVNEQYGNGYSWSSFKTEMKLRKMNGMLKGGKYREFLDEFELYSGYSGDYTSEELNMYKDMFAEDFADYFSKNKIKYSYVQADDGKCEGGEIGILTENMETVIMMFGIEKDEKLYFAGYNSASYYKELPLMNLLYKDSVYTYFELLRNRERLDGAVMFNRTAKNNQGLNSDYGTYSNILKKKYTDMLDLYSYISCETGEIAYRRDALPVGDRDCIYRYFSQETVLTMADRDGTEFTVSFFTAADTTSFPRQAVIGVDNIIYSDNTPDDFKTLFEDIFT